MSDGTAEVTAAATGAAAAVAAVQDEQEQAERVEDAQTAAIEAESVATVAAGAAQLASERADAAAAGAEAAITAAQSAGSTAESAVAENATLREKVSEQDAKIGDLTTAVQSLVDLQKEQLKQTPQVQAVAVSATSPAPEQGDGTQSTPAGTSGDSASDRRRKHKFGRRGKTTI